MQESFSFKKEDDSNSNRVESGKPSLVLETAVPTVQESGAQQ
jgi:hypothetical protein